MTFAGNDRLVVGDDALQAPKGRPSKAWGGSPRSDASHNHPEPRKGRPQRFDAAIWVAVAPSGLEHGGLAIDLGLPPQALLGRPFGVSIPVAVAQPKPEVLNPRQSQLFMGTGVASGIAGLTTNPVTFKFRAGTPGLHELWVFITLSCVLCVSWFIPIPCRVTGLTVEDVHLASGKSRTCS